MGQRLNSRVQRNAADAPLCSNGDAAVSCARTGERQEHSPARARLETLRRGACIPPGRIGVGIESDFLEKFDERIAERAYTNRSAAFRDIIWEPLIDEAPEPGGWTMHPHETSIDVTGVKRGRPNIAGAGGAA